MLKSFAEKLYRPLVNLKDGRTILNDKTRDEILYNAKRIRSKDYLFSAVMEENGQIYQTTVTTTANWYFILTGLKFDGVDHGFLNDPDTPLIGFKFENFYPTTPFSGPDKLRELVPARFLSVGAFRELGQHSFYREEEKNIFYMLGQRVTISAVFKKDDTLTNPDEYPKKINFMASGLEFNLSEAV